MWDKAGHPQVAFSARLLRGVQLSQLPDPRGVHEVMASRDADGWKGAIDRETVNLESHDVYELVPCVHPTFGLGSPPSVQERCFRKNKGRLVAQGNHQRPCIDYEESFLPVMRLESLHTILVLAAIRDLDVIQFNITSAYLHGNLREVYMKLPEGCTTPGEEDWVWHLKKGLYELVQIGGTWTEWLRVHMESEGLMGTPKDPAMYVKNTWTSCQPVAAGFGKTIAPQ